MNENLTADGPHLTESLVKDYGFKPEALAILQRARSMSVTEIRGLLRPEIEADFVGLIQTMDRITGLLGSLNIPIGLNVEARAIPPQPRILKKQIDKKPIDAPINGHNMNGSKSKSPKSLRAPKPIYVGEELESRSVVELNILAQYLRDAALEPLITPQREIELAKLIKAGDEKAREEMILANLRLVVTMAKKYRNLGMPFLDLINEGNMGLMKAVERFRPDKNAKLSTYASWWIKQTIKRALANQSRDVRLPVHLVDKMAHMRRAASELQEQLGRPPTDEEVAEKTGSSEKRVRQMREAFIPPIHLDAPIGDDGDAVLADVIPDQRAHDPAKEAARGAESERLRKLLDRLPTREREMMELRFGLNNGGEPMTLDEVGTHFGVTRERIRQIEAQSILKLRAWMNGKAYRQQVRKKK